MEERKNTTPTPLLSWLADVKLIYISVSFIIFATYSLLYANLSRSQFHSVDLKKQKELFQKPEL
jgi:hypothetical protein